MGAGGFTNFGWVPGPPGKDGKLDLDNLLAGPNIEVTAVPPDRIRISAFPAGNDDELQYNDDGAFAASPHLTFDDDNFILIVDGNVNISGQYQINGVPIGLPAGSDTQIQYNNNGAFGASSNLLWFEGSSLFFALNLQVNNTASFLGSINQTGSGVANFAGAGFQVNTNASFFNPVAVYAYTSLTGVRVNHPPATAPNPNVGLLSLNGLTVMELDCLDTGSTTITCIDNGSPGPLIIDASAVNISTGGRQAFSASWDATNGSAAILGTSLETIACGLGFTTNIGSFFISQYGSASGSPTNLLQFIDDTGAEYMAINRNNHSVRIGRSGVLPDITTMLGKLNLDVPTTSTGLGPGDVWVDVAAGSVLKMA